MTPTRLRCALAARPQTHDLARLDAPELAIALEALAETTPGDRALAALTAAAQTWTSLQDDREGTGLRLGRVVRWDDWTLTCEATDAESGVDVLARVLRPHARTPVHRRRLAREGRVLRSRLDLDVQHRAGAHPALLVPLDGGPALEGPPADPTWRLRFVLRVLADLEAREVAGLGPVDPDDAELRLTRTGAAVCCLQVDGDDLDLRDLIARLRPWVPDGPLLPVFEGVQALGAGSVAEVADLTMRALASELARLRHEAVGRWRDRRQAHERARLRSLAERLSAFPPPAGRGVVGVDMEGRPTVLIGDGTRLSWGPENGPTLAIVSERGLHPRTARRLLRARSDAPPSLRLNREADADPHYTERACRWVAAALSLRTIRMLLEVPA